MNTTSTIWDAISLEGILANVPRQPLPECNRGSWFCPVATKADAQKLDYILRKTDIETIYDLGAGDLKFSVAMDNRGYDVIAYESIEHLVEYAQRVLPANDVEVRTRDYYADWSGISNDKAAFVALGMVNCVPGEVPNGLAFDGMEIEK